MSTNVSLIPIEETRIRQWTEACQPLGKPAGCDLATWWAGIHYLLTGDVNGGDLPLAALRRGDVTLGESRAARGHALLPATVAALSEELELVSEGTLRKRWSELYDLTERGGFVHPGRYWGNREHLDARFREVRTYLERLREVVRDALCMGEALVVLRYEDS